MALDGDHAVINWVLEMTTGDGSARRMDEIAPQAWVGEHIVEEQFYHDPGQLASAV